MTRVLQRWWRPAALVGLGVGQLGWVAAVWAGDPRPRLDHPAILVSALFAVGWLASAGVLLLRVTPVEWAVGSPLRGLARLAWGVGVAVFAAHALAAFGLGHGWSHDSAVRHTAEVAGVGEGVYVNYLFGLVWAADAAWLAGWPRGYGRRPRAIRWAAHGFLAFVTFNATVVFGGPWAKGVGVAGFAVLGWFAARRVLVPRDAPWTVVVTSRPRG